MNEENVENNKKSAVDDARPDEEGGFHIEGHIKIFDPENAEVFTDIRG